MAMNLKNGLALLVTGALAFAARKRGPFSRFERLIQSPTSPPTSLDPDSAEELECEVRILLAQGRKIAAVKYVREYTHWGLKASKAFVDGLENSASAAGVMPAARASQPAGIPAAVHNQANALVQQGRIIDAIKHVREATGWGLKEAKDYVDRLR